MSDREIALRIQQERGAKAKALLDNQLLQEAFQKIGDDLTKAWEDAKPEQIQLREDAWRSKKLLGKLQNALRSHVITGSHASKELLKMQDPNFLQKMVKPRI